MCVYSSSRRPPFFSVFAALSIRLMIASTRHSRLDSPRLMLYRRNHGKGEPVSKRRVGPDYFARGEFGGKISKAFILRDATLIVSESYFCPTFGGRVRNPDFPVVTEGWRGEKRGKQGTRGALLSLSFASHAPTRFVIQAASRQQLPVDVTRILLPPFHDRGRGTCLLCVSI